MPSSRASLACASPPRDRAAVHLLNGLYDASMDGQPGLAVTGLSFHDLIGTRTQPVWRWISSSWTWQSSTSGSWVPPTWRTWRISCAAPRWPIEAWPHLAFPVDLQEAPAQSGRSKGNVGHHTSDIEARSARLPAPQGQGGAWRVSTGGIPRSVRCFGTAPRSFASHAQR